MGEEGQAVPNTSGEDPATVNSTKAPEVETLKLSPESVIRIRPAPAPNEDAFTKKLNEPRNCRTLRDDVRSLIQISQPLTRKIDIVWGKFVHGLKKADCDIRSGVVQNLCDRSDMMKLER